MLLRQVAWSYSKRRGILPQLIPSVTYNNHCSPYVNTYESIYGNVRRGGVSRPIWKGSERERITAAKLGIGGLFWCCYVSSCQQELDMLRRKRTKHANSHVFLDARHVPKSPHAEVLSTYQHSHNYCGNAKCTSMRYMDPIPDLVAAKKSKDNAGHAFVQALRPVPPTAWWLYPAVYG